jgi:xanthine dehydrogenase accessory factor
MSRGSELEQTPGLRTSESARVGRAVVVRTHGSAPRPVGSVMLWSSDGRIEGSISGGCVEGAAAEEVAEAMTSGKTKVVRYGITDQQAWSVGLACGGTIDVLIEPEVPAQCAHPEIDTAVITPLPAEPAPPGARLVTHADGRMDGTSGDAELDADLLAAASEAILRGASRTVIFAGRGYLIEAFANRPRIVIVGAVEIAQHLVRLGSQLGFESVVVDGRPAFATAERFPGADRLIVGWLDEVAGEIGLGSADSVAVLTHDPKFDEPAIATALARGCRYVGAIGSRRTQADRQRRLRDSGFTETQLANLRGPIGLDLGGRSAPEIALAILAEMVAVRYGAPGAPMSAA